MKLRIWFAAAIFAPFVCMSANLWLAEHCEFKAAWPFYVGWVLSMIAGLWCLWQLPTSRRDRTVASIVFVIVLGCASMFTRFFLHVSFLEIAYEK
jgi:hypothetical protein